jgi:acetyl-CoA C-acetyltransferase
MDPRQPVIVGAGQVTNRPKTPNKLVTPVELMEEVSTAAIHDTTTSDIVRYIDTVYVVNIISWTYADPAGELARRLGAEPKTTGYTSIGGNSPQWLVNKACRDIVAGDSDVVLIAGAEAFASGAQARNFGVKLDRGDRSKQPETIGDSRTGLSPEEMAMQLITPGQIYPIIENAFRAAHGRSIDEHQEELGRLFESFNQVARSNPLAWFPEPRSAAEIATPSLENRPTGLPYTKYMNAVMKVDQAAALVVTSAERAERAGIPKDRWVFPVAGADLNDVWFFSRRPDLSRSPAIAACGKAVFEASDTGPDDFPFVDLYSCFPVAVEIACQELGLSWGPERPLTLTGGLPYFGGPGNNYTSHAIAHAVTKLRQTEAAMALCTGLGWFVTKHSIGLYSSEPPRKVFCYPELGDEQMRIDSTEMDLLEGNDSADGRVVAYTVLFDRASKPERIPAVTETIEARPKRCLAEIPLEYLDDPWTQDFCGTIGIIDPGARPRPRFIPKD